MKPLSAYAFTLALAGCTGDDLDSRSQPSTCPATTAFAVSACIC
jgi:hypothetical protein